MKLLRDLASVLNVTVVIAGLGYFVDLFDLTLFPVVRAASLSDLGLVSSVDITNRSIVIYNAGLIGMMIGGVLWGVLSDRKGRRSVMFASILLYSIATLACGMVQTVSSYAFFRFLCGVGLAGEIGSGITLVAESLPREKRGLGTAVVATLGMLGVVAAALLGQRVPWRAAYVIGGVMGLVLLLGRLRIAESTLFMRNAARGLANPFLLFTRARLPRYIACILLGIPIYFTTGILFTFAPELTLGLGVEGVTAGNAVLFGSIGLTLGDILSGLFSQVLRSRKRAIAIMLAFGYGLILVYILMPGLTRSVVYGLTFLIGVTVGYWAMLITTAAEQFGTNIRGTAATTVPNFVRGSAVFALAMYGYLNGRKWPVQYSVLAVGTLCFGVAMIALMRVDETFGRDLDFEE